MASARTLYTQITPIRFSDYTPSRITRPSSNRFLQEHDALEDLFRNHAPVRDKDRSLSDLVCSNVTLHGNYVDVAFVEPRTGQRSRKEEDLIAGRPHSHSDPTGNGIVNKPLFVRNRNESKRTATRKRPTSNHKMDVVVVESEDKEPQCNGVHTGEGDVLPVKPPQRTRAAPLGLPAANKIVITKRRFSPPHSSPPPPPVLSGKKDKTTQDAVIDTATPSISLHKVDPPNSVSRTSELKPDSDTASEEEPQDSSQDSESLLVCRYNTSDGGHDSSGSEDTPIPPPRKHRALSRQTPSPPLIKSIPIPNGRPPSSSSVTPSVPSPLLLDGSVSPPLIGKTKPVPPPRTRSQGTLRCLSDSVVAKPSPGSHLDARRTRSVSFLKCKVGEDCGQFPADYLGSKQADCYIGSVNRVAKHLIDLRTAEVVVYVTSERVRLAPPNNAALLFKSFAMKDILSVQRCSKNKRIIGVVIWKPRSVPVCHVLRCPDHLVANSLIDAIWLQSQSVDDVTLSKVSQRPLTPEHQRPTSDISSSSEGDSISSLRDIPVSPTELLHKFSAIHIGSSVAGKLHSVNEVIQRVLTENQPSQAKKVDLWLSLAQVRLVDTENGTELIYATHETSRIRAIGVYSTDKRFIGYIIKEEGKPLTGHVLRCNSAGLMVQLVSFLRQSCQITFYQRGGSFYDELSTDDSEECDSAENSGNCENHSLIKRLRSLTLVTQRSGSNHASFVSHTPLLRQFSNDSPPKKRDSIQIANVFSPLDFTEDDYARFSVTYIGSAILDLPLTCQSVVEALRAFHKDGMAAGLAAVSKNIIHMQVSSLGINLTDKKHRLFVSRNYPRKQLEGCCVHPQDSKCFAFASRRPGFPDSIKCHVFREVQEPVQQIMDSIKFWLELEPTL